MDNQKFDNLIKKHSSNMLSMYNKANSDNAQSDSDEFKALSDAQTANQITANDDSKTYEQFLEDNQNTGTLKVQVSTGEQSLPISGAKVSIRKKLKDGIKVFSRTVTDENGISDKIVLRAPDRKHSLDSDDPVSAYASYEILVTHPYFVQQTNLNCQIFDGIKSIQLMNMAPYDTVSEKSKKGAN